MKNKLEKLVGAPVKETKFYATNEYAFWKTVDSPYLSLVKVHTRDEHIDRIVLTMIEKVRCPDTIAELGRTDYEIHIKLKKDYCEYIVFARFPLTSTIEDFKKEWEQLTQLKLTKKIFLNYLTSQEV